MPTSPSQRDGQHGKPEESASLAEGKGVREGEAPEGPPCEAAGHGEGRRGREGRYPEKFAEIRVRQVQNSPGLDC